jgi:hypothetical protein
LRCYQNRELEEEDCRADEAQHRAAKANQRGEDSDSEDDEVVVEAGAFVFRDEGKANKWSFDMRKRIMKLLMLNVAPSNIGSVMEVFGDGQPFVYPSEWFMREMRSELRIVVEALAARAAADQNVRSPFHVMLSMPSQTHLLTHVHYSGHLATDRV